MAQVETFSHANRYPGVFLTSKAYLANRASGRSRSERLRILSFGCSDGSEINSLRAYFPDSLLFGCDINLKALGEAKRNLSSDESVLFISNPRNIKAFGPYDVIFAMSVLCQFPASTTCKSLQAIFPFSEFEHHVSVLAENLKSDGLLCIYNANYLFSDLSLSHWFSIVRSPLMVTNGFVDKFRPDGSRLTTFVRRGLDKQYHRVESRDHSISDSDFTDCIFQRNTSDSQPAAIWPEFLDEIGPDVVECLGERQRFGVDLGEAQRNKWIACGLFLKSVRDCHGGFWIGREFRHTTMSGAVKPVKSWWSLGTMEEWQDFSIEQRSAVDEFERSMEEERSRKLLFIRRAVGGARAVRNAVRQLAPRRR